MYGRAGVRALDITTLILVIVGGLNWGLVGAFEYDLVSAIFGTGAHETARSSTLSRIIYIIVGLSALWQIKVLASMISATSNEPRRP